MKKEEIRKEFFKLRIKRHSYSQCRKIIFAQFGYETTVRTLQRWDERLRKTEWNLNDYSKRPKNIYYKTTDQLEKKIVELRNKTGYGEYKLVKYFPEISHTKIYEILKANGLTKINPNRRKRIKYIRWQRNHINSLWQMDVSDQKIEGKYCFAVIDDCSRYCLGLFALNRVSTSIIIYLLDTLFKTHGYPREILTDNGSVFGLKSKHSKFDVWCRRRHIKHIRTAIHSPTTSGKIERFFQTLSKELEFCKNDSEVFRMMYNHFRPHSSLENKSPAEIYFDLYKLK
jgi:transposase InsO family protein